jgi:hypothetical protein
MGINQDGKQLQNTAGHIGALGWIDAIQSTIELSAKCAFFKSGLQPERHSEVAGGIKRRSQHVWRCQMCRWCHFNSATIDAVGCWTDC